MFLGLWGMLILDKLWGETYSQIFGPSGERCELMGDEIIEGFKKKDSGLIDY